MAAEAAVVPDCGLRPLLLCERTAAVKTAVQQKQGKGGVSLLGNMGASLAMPTCCASPADDRCTHNHLASPAWPGLLCLVVCCRSCIAVCQERNALHILEQLQQLSVICHVGVVIKGEPTAVTACSKQRRKHKQAVVGCFEYIG